MMVGRERRLAALTLLTVTTTGHILHMAGMVSSGQATKLLRNKSPNVYVSACQFVGGWQVPFCRHFFASGAQKFPIWWGIQEGELLGSGEGVAAPAFDGDVGFPLLADLVGGDVSRTVDQDGPRVLDERARLLPCDAKSRIFALP